MYIKVFITGAVSQQETFSWDTNGISFVIDNSATAIISNERRLFTGKLNPTSVTLHHQRRAYAT